MKKLTFILAAGLMLGACSEEEATPVPQEKAPVEEVESVKSEPIEVEMNVEAAVQEDGKVIIEGTTNLPDDGELMFTFENTETDFKAQSKNKVKEGSFSSDAFSDQGEALKPGDYNVRISLSIASLQSDEFVSRAGEDYKNLSGDLMKEGDIGKSMTYEKQITIE